MLVRSRESWVAFASSQRSHLRVADFFLSFYAQTLAVGRPDSESSYRLPVKIDELEAEYDLIHIYSSQNYRIVIQHMLGTDPPLAFLRLPH